MKPSNLMITEEDIRTICTAESYKRGRSYFHNEAIVEPTRQGDQLTAYCHGSEYTPYRVTATLSDRGIGDVSCTCPYDWGGICKHIVALLLTWVHQADHFREMQTS